MFNDLFDKEAGGKPFHAYFLIGKRDEAEEAINHLARTIACRSDEIFAVDSLEEATGKAGEIKAQQVRELIHFIQLSSKNGRVGVIYNADRLNISSANLLLKTLEEPPENRMIILVAEKERILPTIKSRCRIYRSNSEAERIFHNFSYKQILANSIADCFISVDKIVKENELNSFFDNLERDMRRAMVHEKEYQLTDSLKQLLLARKRVEQNANVRLTIENLILKIKG